MRRATATAAAAAGGVLTFPLAGAAGFFMGAFVAVPICQLLLAAEIAVGWARSSVRGR